ncbi:MAG: NAD-dependent epimerase/dehydratase family protein [Oscillospiraceae bacterium]|jgi:UDP-2-acetamido-2,6-beta-L-arabino-hexul-4-ose reductase|nr:NAD-dependent epimerase/dehydratase family protein [Oscillospiraceae bacterium]
MNQSSPILITGSGGFVGKNLVATLKAAGYKDLMCFEKEDTPETLKAFCKRADFVIHLAGINRPKNPSEFYVGNAGLTETLLSNLEEAGSHAPVLVTSSTQAALDNDYGKSKLEAENAVFAHGEKLGSKVYVFRMEGVFGKWCRPNYNSVVATFCYNVAHGMPIQVRDPDYELPLVYIDDVVRCILEAMDGKVSEDSSPRPICHIHPVHKTTLGHLAETIQKFAESRTTLAVPSLAQGTFEKKLYSTYVSYLPEEAFFYPLTMHADQRGSFTEILRTPERGQFSVNIIHPGIVKGNHWHHSKTEKYLVVSGTCTTRLRKLGTDKVYEIVTSSKEMKIIDIPTGYTHNIENTGSTDAAVFMWVNEPFDPQNPDTFMLKV